MCISYVMERNSILHRKNWHHLHQSAREDGGHGHRFWVYLTFMMNIIFCSLNCCYWLKCHNSHEINVICIKIIIIRNMVTYTVIDSNILEECVASIFKLKAHDFHSLSRCWYPSTNIIQHHIPKECDPNIHHYKNLIFRKWSPCLQAIGTLRRIVVHHRSI
jgi:hypothetical protein